MMLRRKKRSSLKTNHARSFEHLELRQLMAVDLHDSRLAKNWVPDASEIRLENVSVPSSSAKTSIDWQQVLAPQADKLFQGKADPTAGFRVTSSHYDETVGASYVYLQQTVGGIDVVNAYANLTVLDNGKVFNAASSFVPAVQSKGTLSGASGISAEQALANVAQEYGWAGLNISQITRGTTTALGKQSASMRAPAVARTDVPFESVYIPKKDGTLDIGWRINVQASQGDAWLDAAVSKVDGQVLYVADWNSDAQYLVFNLPKESPTDGPRVLLTDPQLPAFSPFGWHDTNGVAGAESTLTIGNNTQAYRDLDDNNLPDAGTSPSGGASLIFTPPLDLTQGPVFNADASTVNLFYVTNAAHDIFAAKGFTAAAGNFQTNNYGAGGLGGDPLLAEDRDGGGTDNANMATPPDGISPRMQMYDWTLTAPGRSGSFDNGVVVHEFGHGVTNRLTGGPANSSALSNLQSGGMGEGWSDFFALIFTQVATDAANVGRGIGTYVLGQPSTGSGIRSQLYTYDMSVNTWKFGNLNSLNEVHDIGEIWATVLWDLNWAFIGGSSIDPTLPNTGLGFNANLAANTGGNNLALALVVQALKLQPANPTFLDARDAILSADQLLNGGANQRVIWQVFARRGMGLSAVATDSDSNQVTEAFDTPIFSPLIYKREGLFGSNMSRAEGPTLPFVTAGSEQLYQFTAEATSKVSFTLTPTSPLASLTVKVINSTNGIALGPFTGAPGGKVAIPPWTVSTSGTYRLSIAASLPTSVQLESARNAALESQVGDSDYSAEMTISASQRVYNTGNTNEVIGTSDAGIQLTKGNSAAKFVDIAATGTAIFLSDDGEAQINSTVGNSFFPAGPVTISSNGVVLASPLVNVTYLNSSLLSLPTTPTGLYPFWDDLYEGDVYWQELPVGGINTLVIQWQDRPHYPGTGAATFQVQIPATGTVLARYAYKDVLFENATYDGGASATVGAIGVDGPIQYSFDTASLANNDFIELALKVDIDEYRFNGVAGQKVGVAFDALGLDAANINNTYVRLLDAANVVLAQASTKPIGAASTVSNYDLGITNYVLPSTGPFSVRVYGRKSFDYYLAITKNLALDTENSTGATSPRYATTLPGAVLGHMNVSDIRDLYTFPLNVGQKVRLTLTRPDDDAGVSPVNSLVPKLIVTRPNGSAGASSSTFNTAGQIILTYTATESGLHFIDVRRLGGAGVYAVRSELLASLGEGETAAAGLAITNDVASTTAATSTPSIATSTSSVQAPVIDRSTSSLAVASWQNTTQPVDINGDGRITALDALLLINELNSRRVSTATGQLPPRTSSASQVDQFFDTNGDGVITPLDALLVVDYLNRK